MQIVAGNSANYRIAAYFLFICALSVIAHIPALQKYASVNFNYGGNGSYEDRSKKIGDFTYYLHGALSIYDFTVEKKFNGKHQPIIGQKRDIKADDMPWYASYALAIYPYPSFKFGYSLTAAILTLPLPDSIFEQKIPRLTFVNIILNAVSACLIFLIIRGLTGSIAAAVVSSLFFIFDVSNTHNSYLYQSHTTSGIFYLLLAFLIFVRSSKVSAFKFGLIAFLVALGVLSSSHILPIAFFVGLLMFARLSYKVGYREIAKYAIAGFIGSAALPTYIVGVEAFFKFQELGLPTLFAQLENYKSTVGALIRTYPPHLRMMWDIRLFNIFIVVILIITTFIAIYARFVLRRASTDPNVKFRILNDVEALTFNFVILKDNTKDWLLRNSNSIIAVASVVAATAVVAFYTQPISRAMTPYTSLYGVLLGAYLGKKFVANSKVVKISVLGILILVIGNYYLLLGIVKLPERNVPAKVFALDENEIIWKNTHEFFKILRADQYEYRYISKGLGEFIKLYDHQLTDDTFIKFDGFDLVFVYSPTRRFIRDFVPDPRDVVNQNTYLKDFRFLAEVFDLRKKNLLRDEDIIRVKKRIWNFELWDQEYNYIYGYMNSVGKYLENTPLEGIEAKYTYYINYGALKNAYRLAAKPPQLPSR